MPTPTQYLAAIRTCFISQISACTVAGKDSSTNFQFHICPFFRFWLTDLLKMPMDHDTSYELTTWRFWDPRDLNPLLGESWDSIIVDTKRLVFIDKARGS